MRGDWSALEVTVDGRTLKIFNVPMLPSGPYAATVVPRNPSRGPAGDLLGDDVELRDLMLAIEDGAVSLDSPLGRRMTVPHAELDDDARRQSFPPLPEGYGQRVAAAVRAYAEWLAERVGGTVQAPDPQRWPGTWPGPAPQGVAV